MFLGPKKIVDNETLDSAIEERCLVVESMGGWHATAERQVKKLGSCLARHTGQSEGEAISHLWGRLGILLQRGNAAILANRVPTYPACH